jgi:serine/threonine-protein kinase
VLDLGLVYVVIMALGVGLVMHWEGRPRGAPMNPELSWIGVMILVVAAILPTSPRKLLLAGGISIAMNPVGMLIAQAHGTVGLGTASTALLMHYPDVLLLGVALVISGVVTQLGRQVTKAREAGSYELTELIGQGGMGEVYKARHRMFARAAAIKLIRPEVLAGQDHVAAELSVKRFRREAEAAANLRSPHTVEIYDFGITEDSTFYFVMELLDGMDLESLVRQHGPLPSARVIHIVAQVCDSLEEAHRAGLVHRDIKPANIHVGPLGLHHDFVKVLDFGLVKPVAKVNADHSLATVEGQITGTPAYMPPEMALGDVVDGRADIYALGCVAYYLLTAELVFNADSSMQMMARHLKSAPRKPSQRTNAFIPRELDELVVTCLAKDPKDRPQTAAELARALEAIDMPAWGNDDAARWWSANQRPEPAGAL